MSVLKMIAWRLLLYPDPLIMEHSEACDDRGCGGVCCLQLCYYFMSCEVPFSQDLYDSTL